VVAPEGDERDRVHQDYVDMASSGHVNDRQRQTFFEAGRRLCERGAEAVMLGGTDLFLAFVGHDCGFPLIDCADIHVDAIYRKSSAA
jgi:aspartate racemase